MYNLGLGLGNRPNNTNFKQLLFDELAAQADFIVSPISPSSKAGGAYSNPSGTIFAENYEPVLSLRGWGNNPRSITLLPFTSGSGLPLKSERIVWNNARNKGIYLTPYIIDRGNFDRWLQLHNSVIGTSNYETNPGSLSPSLSRPIDIIFALRYTPRVAFESIGLIKDQGGTIRFNGSLGALDGNVGFDLYQDQVVRVYIDGSGNWNMWKNQVLIGSGSGGNLTDNELYIGTVSHVLESHLRYIMYKFGGPFPSASLDIIYNNTQQLFPWTKPSYPHIDNLWQGGFSILSASVFLVPGNGRSTTFSGGTGISGSHLYQWFYVDTSDTTLFPGGDIPFACNRQIPGTIDLSTMGSGNTISAVNMDGINILSGTIIFSSSTQNTAATLTTAINVNASSSGFFAYQRTSSVQIHILNNNYRPDILTVITSSGWTPTIRSTCRTLALNKNLYSSSGQIFNNHFTDGAIRVMCVIYPFDSAGISGESIATDWTTVNF